MTDKSKPTDPIKNEHVVKERVCNGEIFFIAEVKEAKHFVTIISELMLMIICL